MGYFTKKDKFTANKKTKILVNNNMLIKKTVVVEDDQAKGDKKNEKVVVVTANENKEIPLKKSGLKNPLVVGKRIDPPIDGQVNNTSINKLDDDIITKQLKKNKSSGKKIAFMFLTVDDLKLSDEWYSFFGKDVSKVNIYSHIKKPMKVTQKFLLDSDIKDKVNTEWGKVSLVEATNNLLREAYKNSDNEYFVLLSDSCIPMYDITETTNKIFSSGKSWVYYYTWDHENNAFRSKLIKNIKFDVFYKQSQWMVLKRSHVKLILENDNINNFRYTLAPDEHYYINILKKFNPDFDSENINYPATFVNWVDSNNAHPKTYNKVNINLIKSFDSRKYFGNNTLNISKEEDNSLFFRKVNKDTDIIRSDSKLNKIVALDNLKIIDKIFVKNNVEYWLSCGTLLGYYRSNDFIGHDVDTDVCVNIEDLTPKVISEIKENGFKIKHVFGKISDGFELTLVRKDLRCDLFFFYKKEDYWYHSVYSDFTEYDSIKHDYVYNKFDIHRKEFLGYEFPVPVNTREVLIEQYGENFMEPNKEWYYHESPKNIRHTNTRVKKSDSAIDLDLLENSLVNNKITLLIKSFMRNDCVYKLINSIRVNYKNIKIIVVDDSKPRLNFDIDKNIKTYNIDFDSGLSAGRNYGVTKIDTEYFILLDDDFIFTEKTDLNLWLDIMVRCNLDILGGYVIENNKPLKYFGTFYFSEKNKTILTKDEFHDFGEYKTCDIIPNFFIAKTDKIKEFTWDNDLKLNEHTAFFFKHRNSLSVGFTDKVSVIHDKFRDPNYIHYRDRAKQFLKTFMDKEDINKIITASGVVYDKKNL